MRFRITMLFAVCTLLLVMIPGYSITKNAIHAMFWGILGAFIVGIIGFFIAGILCHPMGNDNNKWPGFFKGLFSLQNPEDMLAIDEEPQTEVNEELPA